RRGTGAARALRRAHAPDHDPHTRPLTPTPKGAALEELTVEHGGISLAASYSPAGEAAIVALHGAGEGTRDAELYGHLHELLPPAGIGVATLAPPGCSRSRSGGGRQRPRAPA